MSPSIPIFGNIRFPPVTVFGWRLHKCKIVLTGMFVYVCDCDVVLFVYEKGQVTLKVVPFDNGFSQWSRQADVHLDNALCQAGTRSSHFCGVEKCDVTQKIDGSHM